MGIKIKILLGIAFIMETIAVLSVVYIAMFLYSFHYNYFGS